MTYNQRAAASRASRLVRRQLRRQSASTMRTAAQMARGRGVVPAAAMANQVAQASAEFGGRFARASSRVASAGRGLAAAGRAVSTGAKIARVAKTAASLAAGIGPAIAMAALDFAVQKGVEWATSSPQSSKRKADDMRYVRGSPRRTPSKRPRWSSPQRKPVYGGLPLRPKLSPKWRGVSTGRSAGKFKRPKKLRMTFEKKALILGHHATNEIFGKVEDPHCLYITHATVNIGNMANVIALALLRLALKNQGVVVRDFDVELPIANPTNSSGYRFIFSTIDALTGTVASGTPYDTVDDNTLIDISNGLTMPAIIANCMYGQNLYIPYSLGIYVLESDGTQERPRLLSELLLHDLVMTIVFGSTLSVQNRSSGALATGDALGQLDRVDNQPVVGRLYNFRNADPRLRMPKTTNDGLNYPQLNRIPDDGVSLLRAATINSSGEFEEPMSSIKWANCTKASNIGLEPGFIKTTYIQWKFHGKLVNFFKKYSIVYHDTNTNLNTGVPGKSQMLILEEKLRTESSNPITIQYEVQQKIGCFFKKGKSTPFRSTFTKFVKNDVPPPPEE